MSDLLSHVRQSRRVLLTGPDGPDGDSIGACLALRRVLAVAAPEVEVHVAGVAPPRYRGLPDAHHLRSDAAIAPGYDGVVVMDGDHTRLTAGVAAAFEAARWTGLVDHHASTRAEPYTIALLDPAAESTCGMVRALAGAWGVPLDEPLAELLYAGVIFDTGGFRYSNTRVSTHLLAAELLATGIPHAQIMLDVLVERRPEALRLFAAILSDLEWLEGGRVLLGRCPRERLEAAGASEPDLEGIVDHLQHTAGVQLAALAVERVGRVKVSLRSREGVNVALLARQIHESGGGHAKAAGVVMQGGWGGCIERLRTALVGAVSAQ